MQDFCFQPGIGEAASIQDQQRISAGGEQVGENIANAVWLLVAQVCWGNLQVLWDWGRLSGSIAHSRKKNSVRLFICTFFFLLFYNLGNIWGINQLLFQQRAREDLQPPCSRWGQCKSNGSVDKTWAKGNTVQRQGRNPSEGRFEHRVCSLQCERASKCSALLERCLVQTGLYLGMCSTRITWQLN